MSPPPLTVEERARIARMVAEGGWTYAAMAERLGRGEATVRRAVKESGGRPPVRKTCGLDGCGRPFHARDGRAWADKFCCAEHRAEHRRRERALGRKPDKRPNLASRFDASTDEERAVARLRKIGPVYPLRIVEPKADPSLWMVWGRRRGRNEMLAMAEKR